MMAIGQMCCYHHQHHLSIVAIVEAQHALLILMEREKQEVWFRVLRQALKKKKDCLYHGMSCGQHLELHRGTWQGLLALPTA